MSLRVVPSLLLLLIFPQLLPGQEQQPKPREEVPQTREQAKKPKEPPPKEETRNVPGVLDTIVLSQGLRARAIGPAIMGGRVAALALDPMNPYTFYVGLGTGGVMKTTDNGQSFTAVFEKQPVAAIGAITVAPSDSSVVWVGTGEANDRNSSGWGNGVYRSTDGGTTWAHVGLDRSKTIARIVVPPSDPKSAWVAAMGDLWVPGGERGCYRTTDAGATWKLALSAASPYDDRVGCGDLAIDPQDPNVVYAALYARQRQPWTFRSGVEVTDGKDVGGIFKSTDGGKSWRKLTDGLPTRTQRIGLAVFRKNPNIVYAVVQSDEGGTSSIDELKSKRGGVFRSEDGGEHWKRVNPLNPRPFYFSQIRVDPENDQRIYVLGYVLHVSEDGGKSFREDQFKHVHVDNHALEIDPRSPKHLILGNDGGVYQTFNGGDTWDFLNRMAAGEYYRINADRSTPYRICGGLQDNSNWVGPSRTWVNDSIANSDWTMIGGGDGFYCVFDNRDPNTIYAESQQGYLYRINLSNGETKDLRPEPTEGQSAFRYNWSSPIIASHHAGGVLYLAGNRVFKLSDRGERWEAISGDLSTGDLKRMIAVGSGAEAFGVVYTLAESPLKAGLLWAGTDDGKLWKTEDDGRTWSDLTKRLPGPAKGLWVSRIEPGAHNAQVAYVAVDGHRTGVYAPLAYRTADGGKTWTSITGNLPQGGPVKVVREDPTNPDLLFAGTEFGLYATLDRGGRWFKFGKLPTVAVDDILIHPRERDLVIATHGRSLYIIDDLRPLEELTPEIREKDVHLFTIRPTFGRYMLPGWVDFAGTAVFRGANPPDGALISFYIRRYAGESVSITITNALDQPVANLTAPGVPGISRVNWDLKPTKDLLQEYGGLGPDLFVPSGEYTVQLKYGDTKLKEKVQVEIARGIETRRWPERR